jgi:hypothetical protein
MRQNVGESTILDHKENSHDTLCQEKDEGIMRAAAAP